MFLYRWWLFMIWITFGKRNLCWASILEYRRAPKVSPQYLSERDLIIVLHVFQSNALMLKSSSSHSRQFWSFNVYWLIDGSCRRIRNIPRRGSLGIRPTGLRAYGMDSYSVLNFPRGELRKNFCCHRYRLLCVLIPSGSVFWSVMIFYATFLLLSLCWTWFWDGMKPSSASPRAISEIWVWYLAPGVNDSLCMMLTPLGFCLIQRLFKYNVRSMECFVIQWNRVNDAVASGIRQSHGSLPEQGVQTLHSQS